jgi:magnesium chelatase family protein
LIATVKWHGLKACQSSPRLSLTSLVNHIHGRQFLHSPTPKIAPVKQNMPDLVDLKGQDTARLAGLLPPLGLAEVLDITMLHSVADNLTRGGLIQNRPFRGPHHSASIAALVAGDGMVGRAELAEDLA